MKARFTGQKKSSTSFNRTPNIFLTARMWARRKFGAGMNYGRLRILSFGCSDGSEMDTLRAYFPSAVIFGCDLQSEADFSSSVYECRAGKYFESTPENVKKHGPYDIVCALSVLCRQPVESTMAVDFPFSTFVSMAEDLHDNLKPGGLLAVYNSSYLFRELPFSGFYRAVRSPMVASNGWVTKWLKDGTAVSSEDGRPFTVLNDVAVRDDDFIDSLFEKCAGAPCVLRAGVRRPFLARLITTRTVTELGSLDLTEELFRDLFGHYWVKREWSVPSVAGGMRRLGAWWEPAASDVLGADMPPIPPTYEKRRR